MEHVTDGFYFLICNFTVSIFSRNLLITFLSDEEMCKCNLVLVVAVRRRVIAATFTVAIVAVIIAVFGIAVSRFDFEFFNRMLSFFLHGCSLFHHVGVLFLCHENMSCSETCGTEK